MKIVPALLTQDITDFETQFLRLFPFCKTFQIDIQDGIFVPSKTIRISEFVALTRQKNPTILSMLKKSVFDFHLMEHDYAQSLDSLICLRQFANVRYVFMHFNYQPNISESYELTICPTFNPQDVITKDTTFIGKNVLTYPAIQVMTINPGPQGQAFIPEQLEKIRILREMGYRGAIFIDGAVNEQTLNQIAEFPKSYWPDVLCVGSYLSKAPEEELSNRIGTLSQY